MKKNLQKITVFTFLFLYNGMLISQTWDTILNGINKVMSNTKYPDCNEVLIVNGANILAATLSGVYKSSNNGTNWTKATIPGPTPGYVGDGYIGVRKVNSNRIIALGMGGSLGNSISKSDDDGNTWAASITGIVGNRIVEDLSLTPNGNIYIATRLGASGAKVYKSIDNGDSWVEKSNGITASTIWSVLAVNDSIILVGGSNGIYRTNDTANTWAKIYSTGSNYVVCLKKNSIGTIYAGLASGEILKSTNNGLSWSTTTLVGNGSMVYDIEFDSNDNIYVCIYGGGIAKFNSSEALLSILGNNSNGLENTRLYDIAIDESGSSPVFYASSAGSSGVGGCIYRYGITNNVGIKESNLLNKITLFPNPAQNTLFISGTQLHQINKINILSIDGRWINTFENSVSINVSSLKAGIYFIEIEDKSGAKSLSKFIKE
ncbi:MAG: T9SS type A sorting domain-containing protein [Bacteroidia bacterium]|nr:T9SS type A sorting domain-containing protein [Bacteroidia bacterium]